MDFDEMLERLFKRGNSSSTLVARPMVILNLINYGFNHIKIQMNLKQKEISNIINPPSNTQTFLLNFIVFSYQNIKL